MKLQQQHHTGEIAAILFSIFVIMTGYGVLLPVLPFFAEKLALRSGLDQKMINFHISILTGIYPFFQLVFAPCWGRLSDRFGRKGFIVLGLLGFILMQAMIGLSSSLTMFYVARITGGIFASAVIPIGNAYLSDITSRERRSRAMAWSGAAISTGLVAGPVVGGHLSRSDFHISLATGVFHMDKFSIPFIALVLPGLAALFVVLKELRNRKSEPGVIPVHPLVATVPPAGYSMLVLALLSFIFQFSLASFETVFSMYAKSELLFNAWQTGTGFMICGLFMGVLQPVFAGGKAARFSQKGKLLSGFALAAIALFAISFSKAYLFVYLVIALFAVGGALIAPQLTAMVSLRDERNTAGNLSLQASVNSMGQMLGPLIGTWLAGERFYRSFMMNGLLLVIAVLTMTMVSREGVTFKKIPFTLFCYFMFWMIFTFTFVRS